MSKKPDPYASEEDTVALMRKDARTPAERELDRMLEERGASEQGAEPTLILRQIALELLAEQPAPATELQEQEPVVWLTGCPSCGMDSCDCDEGTWNPPAQPQQEPVVRLTVPESHTGLITSTMSGADKLPPGEYVCYTSPPARKPLRPIVDEGFTAEQRLLFKYGWKSAEAAHGIKGDA